MSQFSRIGWVLILILFLAAACTPKENLVPTSTPPVVLVNITPAARPTHTAVTACAAALSGIEVEIAERFASQSNSDLLIRLGIPEEETGFLAQIAQDELAVVLHTENPAASLTPNEIQALFSGQVSKWTQYSGKDTPVQVWVPLSVDETLLVFESQILEGLPVVSSANLAPDPEAMLQVITTDPDAVGFLPLSWATPELHAILLGIRLPVLVYSEQPPEGPAADLIACLQGTVGQAALAENYP